jgi:hypothetical protein
MIVSLPVTLPHSCYYDFRGLKSVTSQDDKAGGSFARLVAADGFDVEP